MRVMIAGGRYYGDKPGEAAFLFRRLDAIDKTRGPITLLIHGKCHLGGADNLADVWAKVRGVPVAAYPVEHWRDGRWPSAGPRRTARMIADSRPDAFVPFEGGAGTANATDQAIAAGIEVLDLAP